MDGYDDRPISVYDNLNMPATVHSTGIHHNGGAKPVKMPTPAKAALSAAQPTSAVFDDLSFRFNGNSNNNNSVYKQESLPNGSPSYMDYNNANPYNKQVAAPPHTASHNSQRPLSQHSQAELNETSQNIAAVKAALNDAKSKFFGLNGYASPNSHDSTPAFEHLLDSTDTSTPVKSQPKYQNIPENSAIFRQQHSPHPPELPPKPERLRQSPTKEFTMPTVQQQQQQEMPHTSPKVVPFNTMYQQVPLNDIDTAQPSQAVYMSTTVPQNIKGSKIAGRHTPTRNSLRHSRMLVVNNKNYQVVQHPNPMNFKQPNFARWLLILQIIIGVLIMFVVGWTFVLSANTPIQDNPFWSSLMLIVAGIVGLLLVRYQRIKRQKARENCFVFMRANSCVLSLLALLLCGVACIYASIHYARLTAPDTQCVPSNVLLEHGSCLCSFNVHPGQPGNQTYDGDLSGDHDQEGEQAEEQTTTTITPKPDISYQVEYRDFSCPEVLGVWISILSCSIGLHALGFLVSLLYIVMLVCYRYNSKRLYSSVHVSSF